MSHALSKCTTHEEDDYNENSANYDGSIKMRLKKMQAWESNHEVFE